jgi:hypothetical protein
MTFVYVPLTADTLVPTRARALPVRERTAGGACGCGCSAAGEESVCCSNGSNPNKLPNMTSGLRCHALAVCEEAVQGVMVSVSVQRSKHLSQEPRMAEMELVELRALNPPEALTPPEPEADGVRQQQPGASCSKPAGVSKAPSYVIMKVAWFGALGGFLFGCALQLPLQRLADASLSLFGLAGQHLSGPKAGPTRRYDLALIGGALLLLKNDLHLTGTRQPSRTIDHQKGRSLRRENSWTG